jgi:hypothetical protein
VSYSTKRVSKYTQADLEKAGWKQVNANKWTHDKQGVLEREQADGWYLLAPRAKKRRRVGDHLGEVCLKLKL